MKTTPVYVVAFSTRRLCSLLESAGFTVEPPTHLRHSFIRLVSNPSEKKVTLESPDPTSGEWREISTNERDERPTTDVRAGAYL